MQEFQVTSEHPGIIEIEFEYRSPAVLPRGQKWGTAYVAAAAKGEREGRSPLAAVGTFLRGLAVRTAPEAG